jgi:hypothetical protein
MFQLKTLQEPCTDPAAAAERDTTVASVQRRLQLAFHLMLLNARTDLVDTHHAAVQELDRLCAPMALGRRGRPWC